MRYALLRMYYINISLKNEVNQCDENHGIYITWYSEIGPQVISNLCSLICLRHLVRLRAVTN